MRRPHRVALAAPFLVCFCVLSSPFLRAEQKGAPLTEGEIIGLLQGGVRPERVGVLAQERGITFEVTSAIEGDLRDAGATDHLLQTLRQLSPGADRSKPKKDVPKAANTLPRGILLITADAVCEVTVDGDEAGEVTPEVPKKMYVPLGDHLVRAVSKAVPLATIEWSGTVDKPQQFLVRLKMAEKVASVKAAPEKSAREEQGTPHVSVPSQEPASESRADYAGIGVQIRQQDGSIVVVSAFEQGPAYKAGIRAGDVIFAVDSILTSFKTFNEVAGMIRGPRGSEVHLGVRRPGVQQPLSFKVTREEISPAATPSSTPASSGSLPSRKIGGPTGPSPASPPFAASPGGLDAWKPDAQVGDLQFDVPDGWRQVQTPDGINLVPKGIPQNSVVAISFLPPAQSSDPFEWFRATWANWKGPLNLIDSGEPESKRNPNGFEVLSSYSRAYTPRLGNATFILAAAVAGNRVNPYFYLCNSNCGYDGYQQGFQDFELSLTLAGLGPAMVNASEPGTAGGMEGVYRTYKATEGDVALGTFKVRGHAEYLVFFPDGNVIRFLPKEGLANFDFRAAVRKSRESCGRYWVDGNRLTIHWGDNRTATAVREGKKLQMGNDLLPYERMANPTD